MRYGNARDRPQIWDENFLITSVQISPVYPAQQVGNVHRSVLDIEFETDPLVEFSYKNFVFGLLAFLRYLGPVDRVS